VPFDEDSPELQLRLHSELAQRLRWTGLTYALFTTLFSVSQGPNGRGVPLALCGLMAVLGTLRTILSHLVISGRNPEPNGNRLIRVAGALSLTFGVFLAYGFWRFRGHVIPECLLVVSIAGMSGGGASAFAPFPRLNQLHAAAQLLPLYVWTAYALPRYGWLLLAMVIIHAVVIAQTIRMNGSHLRQMFVAQLTLEAQREDLRQARDAADQAASAKMRFLANMSHEIRTPLNGIMGLAEVLNHLSLNEEQRAVLDDIGRSGQHLLSIVNDVLDMAKVTSGKLSLEQVPFDLRRLIRDMASPAAALAETCRLRFIVEVPPDLPIHAQGDPLRIRQVVSNLLANAVKFSGGGQSVSLRFSAEGGT